MIKSSARVLTFAAFAFSCLAVGFLACGDHPGGTVGDPCESRSTTDECGSGEVCETIDDGSLYCLALCSDDEECAAGESCSGVSGGSLKACHPKSDDDCAFDDKKDCDEI